MTRFTGSRSRPGLALDAVLADLGIEEPTPANEDALLSQLGDEIGGLPGAPVEDDKLLDDIEAILAQQSGEAA